MPNDPLMEHYSQEVKVVLEALIHWNVRAVSLRVLVVVSMESLLVGILNDSRNFDSRLIEAVIHIALLVGKLLDLLLAHIRSIVNHFVENRNRSGGPWILV